MFLKWVHLSLLLLAGSQPKFSNREEIIVTDKSLSGDYENPIIWKLILCNCIENCIFFTGKCVSLTNTLQNHYKWFHSLSRAFSRPVLDWMMFCEVLCYLPCPFPSTDAHRSHLGSGFDRDLLDNFHKQLSAAESYFSAVTTTIIFLCKYCIFLVGIKFSWGLF